PLLCFAGLWTNWTSVRKAKEGEVTADIFAFLTTEPNVEIACLVAGASSSWSVKGYLCDRLRCKSLSCHCWWLAHGRAERGSCITSAAGGSTQRLRTRRQTLLANPG